MGQEFGSNVEFARRLRAVESRLHLLTSMIEAIGWLTVAATLSVVLIFVPRGSGPILPHLFNIAHVAFSAGLALIGYRLSRKLLGYACSPPQWVHLVVGLGTVATFGGGLELAQRYVPGEPSLRDFAIDLLGGLCGILCGPAVKLTKMPWKLVFLVAGAAAGAAGIGPSLRAIQRHQEHDLRFPRLAEFSELNSPYLGVSGGATLGVVEAPKTFPSRGSLIGELTLPAGEGYPGVEVRLPKGDWSKYTNLVLELYLPGDEPLELQFRVHDFAHRNRYEDRFNTEITLRPGNNVLRFAITEVENAPKGRMLDLQLVSTAILFVTPRTTPAVLLLGEWRLE